MRHSALFATVLPTMLYGCSANVCNEAAAICNAPQEADADTCQGKERAFASCLVSRGNCSPATTVACAEESASFDAGVPMSGDISLRLLNFEFPGSGYLNVNLRIRNVSSPTPIPVQSAFFSIEDTNKNLHQSTGGICMGGDALATGGSQDCELQFSAISSFTPSKLHYQGPSGNAANANFPTFDCAAGPENEDATCADGCSNDGDEFTDCDDFDCQNTTYCKIDNCTQGPENNESACSDGCSNDGDDFVDCEDFDCEMTAACGGGMCNSGPEDNPQACSDGCSNDGDRFIDCDDFDCCAARTDCPTTTACGM